MADGETKGNKEQIHPDEIKEVLIRIEKRLDGINDIIRRENRSQAPLTASVLALTLGAAFLAIAIPLGIDRGIAFAWFFYLWCVIFVAFGVGAYLYKKRTERNDKKLVNPESNHGCVRQV